MLYIFLEKIFEILSKSDQEQLRLKESYSELTASRILKKIVMEVLDTNFKFDWITVLGANEYFHV